MTDVYANNRVGQLEAALKEILTQHSIQAVHDIARRALEPTRAAREAFERTIAMAGLAGKGDAAGR